MLCEQGASLKAHLEVVHPEVGGIGVRHIDSYEGNIRFLEDAGHVRSDDLFNLELQDEVHMLAYQLHGILDCDVGILAVIERDQLYTRRRSSSRNALGDGN